MALKSLDVVNLHSFYSYLNYGANSLPKFLSKQYLNLFELDCSSGNFDSVKDYLHQHDSVKTEQNLLRGLLLSIEQNQLKVFQYLIQSPLLDNIIQRHLLSIRNFILKLGQLPFLSALEQHFAKHHQHALNTVALQSLEIALSQLLSYYQSSLTSMSLAQHYQNMLDTLTRLYQQKKAIIAKTQLELPLNYESFQIIKLQFEDKSYQTAYQQHPLHTAWRLLHPDENWFNDDNELKRAKMLSQHQCLVTLMWLAASDISLNVEHIMPINLEQRIEMFFTRLGLICDDEQHLQQHIFQSVIGHPYNQLLTEEVVIFEHERFLQQHLVNQFGLTPNEELHHLLSLLKNHNLINYPEYLDKLKLSDQDYLIFYQKMASKWGAQWENNLNLVQISKEVLLDSHLILQTHQRTCVESIKSLCQQHPLQPGFGFFNPTHHNKAITSINPIATEERVPLSYGVPESPKS